MNTGAPWGLGRGNAGQLGVWAAKGERDRGNRLISVGGWTRFVWLERGPRSF